MKPLEVTIYDATESGALMHIDWTFFSGNGTGPSFLRCRLLPYDPDRLIWIGYLASRPIACDLSRGVINVGGAEFTANLRQLEPFVR